MNGTIKEDIKEYLKENLRVQVEVWCTQVTVQLYLENELISEDCDKDEH